MREVVTTAPPGRTAAAAGLSGWARPLGSAVVLAAGCAVLAVVDPRDGGFYPPCPFLAVTGRWCPGCGTLRAANRMLNGDLAGALAHNPLAVIAAPLVAYALVRWWLRSVGRGRRLPPPTLGRWGAMVVALVVPVFWLLRNLPGFAVLAPG